MPCISTAEIKQPIGLKEIARVVEQLEADAENYRDEIPSIPSPDLALGDGDVSETDPACLGISVNPTGKSTEEQLREYNEYSVAAGFPDLSHLHRPLPYFEEQQKLLAWKQLQQKGPDTGEPDEDHVRFPVPAGAAGYRSSGGIHPEDSRVYRAAEDPHLELSTSSTDYHTTVSDQEYDMPGFVSLVAPDLASQILETQKGGTIYTCNKGIKAAQSSGRLVLPVGAAANNSPRSDSSVSTVDGFPDVPF